MPTQLQTHFTHFATALLLTGLLSGSVQAQSEDSILDLQPYVVRSDTGQPVLEISERDLQQRQATDLEDALSLDPSITVGGSTGVAQKIYVRNLGEAMINVSVDGASQAGALFHHTGRIAVEPDLLRQIDVQPGIGSVSEGPGALGGSIRFQTKDPSDLLRPGQRWGSLLKYGYFGNTSGDKISLSAYGQLNKPWSVLASHVRSDYGNIEDGKGNELVGSGTEQVATLLKLAGSFDNGHSIRLSFENLEEEGEKLRRPEWAPGPGNPLFPMESERQTYTANYRYESPNVDWLGLGLMLSHTEADILQIGPWGPYTGQIEGQQLKLSNTQSIGRAELQYGWDYRRDEVTAGSTDSPSAYSETGKVNGLFVEAELPLFDSLTAYAGARYDRYELEDSMDQHFNHDGFSPSLALVYDLTDSLVLRLSGASAYRGPDINDAFKIDFVSNDPDMEAEKARNYEASLLYRTGGFSAELGAFQHTIDDVITNTLPWSSVYTNAGKLETDGIYARVSYAGSNYNLSLLYNHADTELNDQVATRYQYGSVVSSIGDTWVLDASWQATDAIALGWNSRLVQEIDGISIPEDIAGIPNARIRKPGYDIHDFYLSWVPSFEERITIVLTVKNVFDTHYISHGSIENMTAIPGFEAVIGAAEPGRDIRLSASFQF